MTKRLILCDCLASQSVDSTAIARATGLSVSRVHTALCTREIDSAARLMADGEVIIACAQEADRFAELADDLGVAAPHCVDIRDRAGWSDDKVSSAKMAALLAEAQIERPPEKIRDVTSEGLCLVIGPSDVATAAAERLTGQMSVTVLLTDTGELPLDRGFEVIGGTLRSATGTLGHFALQIDALQTVEPGGRGGFGLSAPRDGAKSRCDVILDLSGNTPLFPAPHKRDGYLRADPKSQPAVAAALFEAAQMVGTFEKTLHLAFEAHLCAHSRAGQIGCSNCLDICPTGAIAPKGDVVEIDPLVCAGCGACSSLCPSGAIKYDAPPVSDLLTRMRVLAETYAGAGGVAPRLLIHDAEHGAQMISLAARFGRGLPADMIPLEVTALNGFGHAEMLAAIATGFTSASVLLSPRTEREPLWHETALAEAMGAAGRINLLAPDTPDALSDLLYATAPAPLKVTPALFLGDRRQVARVAAKALMPGAESPVPLPEGAPYGTVDVDEAACTLCLSCASLCPSGALIDNPDKPQLRFQEDACLQCGICTSACPEDAITLVPRFDPTDAAMALQSKKEEEPFCCIACGAPFGVRSTIERILEKLEGKHSMFPTSDAGRLIRMCDNCRVKAQFHSAENPFAADDRPQVRTTDDYFSKRRDH